MSKIKRQLQTKFCITATQLSPGQPVIIEIEDTQIKVISGNILAISYLNKPPKQIPVKNGISPVEKKIREVVKYIFSVTDLEQLTIPVSILQRDYMPNCDKTSIIRAFHEMGYKSKSGRHQYPVISVGYPSASTDVSEGTDSRVEKQPIRNPYKMIDAHTTYYAFSKTDFLDE